MFYKVIQDGQIIDVLNEIVYVKIQIVHNCLMVCQKKYAEGILSSNQTNVWYVPELIDINKNNYPVAELIEISEDEYLILRHALDCNESIVTESPKEEQEEPTEDDLMTLEFVRNSKIEEMSKACNNVILAGFDVLLSDNQMHHFDFTVEEQLNIMSLKDMINSGATSIPYHASNEPCKFYSVEDILRIIEAGTNLKMYQVTYFNTLKQYINSLKSIHEIKTIEYGMNVPEEYYSEVMMEIMKERNRNE